MNRIEAELGFVEYEGCRVAYRVRGNGVPVLMIQGVGVQGDGWMPQVDDLAQEFTCVTFDNRGMGRSVPAGGPVTVPQMARDALAVLDAAGCASAHVVGHSLGGLVALQVALSARPQVRSLALMCTCANGRAAAPLTPRMLWLGMRARLGTRAMRRNGFLQLVLPPGAPRDAEVAGRLATLFGHDLADQPTIVNEQLRALRGADLSEQIRELAGLPTWVVSATHDPIAPPRLGQALATKIPGAKFTEVADASHGLPITHAAQVNRGLTDHFHAAMAASQV